ncbi:MAG: TRAP transporter small permease [Geminicoccaceae bacterium]|nr:TRAP transporter small permease [Geminicoccaceae bacterium]
MRAFNRFCDAVGLLARAWTLLLAAALFAIVVATVVQRATIGKVPSWSEEVPRYLLIWIGFMAAACGVDLKEHIALELLLEKARGRGATILWSVIDLAVLAFGCVMLVFGIGFVREFGSDFMESIPFRNIWYYISLPISGGLIVLFAARDLLNLWFAPELRTRRLELVTTAD